VLEQVRSSSWGDGMNKWLLNIETMLCGAQKDVVPIDFTRIDTEQRGEKKKLPHHRYVRLFFFVVRLY
jgi:hypothetical protein